MRWRRPGPSDGERLEAAPALAAGLAGALLLLAAFTFGAVPLVVPGVGFLLLGALAPGWVLLAARSGRVTRRLSVRRVVEEEPFEATIEIRRGLLGMPGAVLIDPLAGSSIPVGDALSLLGGHPRLQLRVTARLHRRGRHVFAPPSLRLTDGLGLSRAVWTGVGDGDELLVLPRTETVRWLRPADRRRVAGQGAPASHEPTGSGEIDGLRLYMPGTPASRIHWPALARGAGLLERRLVSEPEAHPLLVLDSRLDDPERDGHRLDAAVRAAASLTLDLARRGGASLLLPGARVPILVGPDLAAWPMVHTRLALVEAEPDPRHGPALRNNRALGSVIYVTARLDPGGRVPGSAAQAAQLVLVVPESLSADMGRAASFSVSRCMGYVLRARHTGPRRRVA